MSRRQTALVVEGGAMRGIFAAGVLDAFLAKGRTAFDHCIGVSAGAVNLAAFLAGQQGRNHNVITDYSCRPSSSTWPSSCAAATGSISTGCGRSPSASAGSIWRALPPTRCR
jgi:hypothetical protein